MPELEKASLQKVEADENETLIEPAYPVQFNPTSLKLKLANKVEGGRSNARQRRQQVGVSSNVLSMELVFDTADEGSEDSPVSVRGRTALVEEFVVPKKDNATPPPRVQFRWNDLIFTGIVESVDIDFDLFAANGVPLRAKLTLSIKEQTPAYQFLRGGPGAATSDDSTAPGADKAGTAPGSGTNEPADAGGGPAERVAPALDGESPAEFASRMGLDPGAWRGLSADLSLGLELEAGIEIGFGVALSAGVGIGVSLGVQAGIGVSLEASLGLEASTGVGATAGAGARIDGDAAGKAMAAVGGVEAAIDAVAIAASEQATGRTVLAFDAERSGAPADGLSRNASGAATVGVASAGAQRIVRVPLERSGPRSHTQQQAAAPAAPPPLPDPRSLAYGRGVPLRPLTRTARERARMSVCATVTDGGVIAAPIRRDPSIAPWIALPPRDTNRERVDALEADKRSGPCGPLGVDCGCERS